MGRGARPNNDSDNGANARLCALIARLRAAACGDERNDAVREFYSLLWRRVVGTIRAAGVDAAEDAAQVFFVKMIRKKEITRIDLERNALAFVLRAAWNHGVSEWRKQQAKKRNFIVVRGGNELADLHRDESAFGASAFEIVEARERQREIAAAFATVPPPARRAAKLRFVEGLSVRETAAEMGATEKQVERWVQEKALPRLRAVPGLAAVLRGGGRTR